MRYRIEHGLDDAHARELLERAWAYYRERFAAYAPWWRWNSDREARFGFSVKGVRIEGSVRSCGGTLEVDVTVPRLLRPFTRRAVAVVEREVQRWLTGEADGGRPYSS